MSKIGIGDKVRVVRGEYVEKCSGRMGVCVERKDTSGGYDFGLGFDGWSHNSGPTTCWWVSDTFVELVEKHVIGVGDKVRLTEVNCYAEWGEKGDTGTVIAYPWEGQRRVRFDRLDKTFYVSPDKLEVVEIAPVAMPAAVPTSPAESEPKFKAGDKVRCLEDSCWSFIKDKTYEVGGHYQEAYVERGNNEKVGIVANELGVADGWCVEFFELVTAQATTPAPLTTVSIGQKLRVGPDGAPYIDKGAIVEVLDIKVTYKDRDGDEVSSSISNFIALSDEELAGLDRDAKREETLKRLREEFTQSAAEFAIGAAVTVSDSSLDNKTGVILYGPDCDGDYLVGTIGNDNRPEEFYYDSSDLKLAA